MPTAAHDLIQSTTLSAPASSVSFSNLNAVAGEYKDLKVTLKGEATGAFYYAYMNMLPNPASQYDHVFLYSTTSSVQAGGGAVSTVRFAASTNQWDNSQAQVEIDIFDAFNTSKYKNVLVAFGNPSRYIEQNFATYLATSSLTGLTFGMFSVQFAAGTTISLYGVRG